MAIWSAGHGAREASTFTDLLVGARIELLADIRTFPGSRRHPQFGRDPLERALRGAGIAYEHLAGLGGRRKGAVSSPHAALREPGFRGYADHTASAEFARDLGRLEALARDRRTAFMCAETLWWKCHRRILADILSARGWEVLHLVHSGKEPERHRMWDLARVTDEGRVVYDQGEAVLFRL
ncbi:MAG TPA: DUF488 domain-containing protein [Candidatus Limnocylindria bacterium]|nr:DUF488 domain-containing protein [Candidatus Limnocylindria bacterium]